MTKNILTVLLLGVSMNAYSAESITLSSEENTQVRADLFEALTPEEKILPMFDRLVSFLQRHDAHFRVIEHEPEGHSEKIARIRGNEPQQSAKALLTMSKASSGDVSYHLVVFPGNENLDFQKLKKLVGIKNTSMAPLQNLEALTECVSGSVPPFSFSPKIKLLVDESLINNNTEIVFNAGRLDRSIFLNAKDYVRIVAPRLAKITK